MPLTNNDLKKIDSLVKTNVELVNSRIDRLEENMNHRFDENDRQHGIINTKLDQLSKRENEDITVVYKDIESIKTRLKKASI